MNETNEEQYHVAVQILSDGQPAYAVFTAEGKPRMAVAQRQEAMELSRDSNPDEMTWRDIDDLGIEEPITAVHWATPDLLYIAAGGNIYHCHDVLHVARFQEVYTGAFDITGFRPGADGVIYAFGEYNFLMRERPGSRGTFEVLVGPRRNSSAVSDVVEASNYLWLASEGRVYRVPTEEVIQKHKVHGAPDRWELFVDFPVLGNIVHLNYNEDNLELHVWWKDRMIAVFEREIVQLDPDYTAAEVFPVGSDEET